MTAIITLLIFVYAAGTFTYACVRYTQPVIKVKGAERLKDVTVKDKILSFVPFVNLSVARKAFFDSSVVQNVMSVVCVVCLAFRLIVFYLQVPNLLLIVASAIAGILSIFLFWLVHVITYTEMALMIDAKKYIIVLCVLCPWLATIWLRTAMVDSLMKNKDFLRGTF